MSFENLMYIYILYILYILCILHSIVACCACVYNHSSLENRKVLVDMSSGRVDYVSGSCWGLFRFLVGNLWVKFCKNGC